MLKVFDIIKKLLFPDWEKGVKRSNDQNYLRNYIKTFRIFCKTHRVNLIIYSTFPGCLHYFSQTQKN